MDFYQAGLYKDNYRFILSDMSGRLNRESSLHFLSIFFKRSRYDEKTDDTIYGVIRGGDSIGPGGYFGHALSFQG